MKKNDTSHCSAQGGFTLVELMVVVAIIAILATIVGVNVMGSVDDANVAASQAQIRALKTAMVKYKLVYKKFPERLEQLVDNPKGKQFLDPNKLPKDPYGNDYQYELQSSSHFVITCYGADGMAGGSGYDADITSDDMDGDD